jgi:hypothetical protein
MAQQAVATLGQLLEQALAAFDDEQKVGVIMSMHAGLWRRTNELMHPRLPFGRRYVLQTVSATTRKRMAVRAIQVRDVKQEVQMYVSLAQYIPSSPQRPRTHLSA